MSLLTDKEEIALAKFVHEMSKLHNEDIFGVLCKFGAFNNLDKDDEDWTRPLGALARKLESRLEEQKL